MGVFLHSTGSLVGRWRHRCAKAVARPTGGVVYVYNQPNFAHSDLCAGAVPLRQGTFTGCTVGAGREYAASCGGAPLGQTADVWFSWTSGCTGTLTLDTAGSDFNTVLSVLTGCPGDPDVAQIACNNDASGQGVTSRLSFNYEPNRTYYIRLGGVAGGEGNYVLQVTDGNGNPPANNTCTGAQDITDGTYHFSTCRAGAGLSMPGCAGQGFVSFDHEVWFRYIAPRTGIATVDLCGSNYPAAVAVHAQAHCPTMLDAPVACSTGGDCPEGQARVQFAATEGQQFYIRVGSPDGFPGGNATMTVSVGTPCPADWNDDGVVNSTDISAFLTTWLASVQANDLAADFNGDQSVNSTDITAFLTAWLQAVQGGC